MAITENTCHAIATTASTRVAETETGVHDFTITDFSFEELIISDDRKGISSGNFTVGGYNWTIRTRLTPVDSNYSNANLSVFLVPENRSSAVKARSIVCLLDQDGKPSKHSFTIGPCMFHFSRTYGERHFARLSELETSKCLVNNSLTIRCTLTVMKASYLQYTKHCHSIVLPPAELHLHLSNLLDSGEGADVTFDVDGELFHAHKLMLAARSPVFKAELLGSMKEASSGSIVIMDMKAPVFKAMLNFIYRDYLLEADLQGGNDVKQDSVCFAEHLFVAADRYGLDRLRLICADKLYNSIDTENVSTILVLAERNGCSQLKEACLEFLARPGVLSDVVTSDEFQDLVKSCPTILKEIPIQEKRKIVNQFFY